MLTTIKAGHNHPKLFHLSAHRSTEMVMRPMVHKDLNVETNVVDETPHISVGLHPVKCLTAIYPIVELEAARLNGTKYINLYLYEVEIMPTDRLVKPLDLYKSGTVYDSMVTEEYWLVTDREYNLTLKTVVRVPTALNRRRLISYRSVGSRTKDSLLLAPKSVKYAHDERTPTDRHPKERTTFHKKGSRRPVKLEIGQLITMGIPMDKFNAKEPLSDGEGELEHIGRIGGRTIDARLTNMVLHRVGWTNLEIRRISGAGPLDFILLTVMVVSKFSTMSNSTDIPTHSHLFRIEDLQKHTEVVNFKRILLDSDIRKRYVEEDIPYPYIEEVE